MQNDTQVFDMSFTAPNSSTGSAIVVPQVNLTGGNVELTQGPINPFFVEPRYRSCEIFATFQGVTGDTLDVYLQNSPDLEELGPLNATWYDKVHFPQLAAGAAAISYVLTLTKKTASNGIVVVGTGLNPALAPNTKIDGDWGFAWRLVIKVGASVTAGSGQSLKLIFT